MGYLVEAVAAQGGLEVDATGNLSPRKEKPAPAPAAPEPEPPPTPTPQAPPPPPAPAAAPVAPTEPAVTGRSLDRADAKKKTLLGA